jgi:hypothetical protein
MPLVDDVLNDMAKNVRSILTACVFVVIIPLQYLLKAMAFFPSKFLESIELFSDKPFDAISLAFFFGFLCLESIITGFLLSRATIDLIKGGVDSASEVRKELGWAVFDAIVALVAIFWLKSARKKEGK